MFSASSAAPPSGPDSPRRIADIKQIQLALELYADSHSQTYPGPDMVAVVTALESATCAGSNKCIPKVPTPPSGASQTAYAYNALTGADAACTSAANDCTKYHLGGILEEATNQALDGDSGLTLTGGFLGESTDCAATAGTDAANTEKCYDVSN